MAIWWTVDFTAAGASAQDMGGWHADGRFGGYADLLIGPSVDDDALDMPIRLGPFISADYGVADGDGALAGGLAVSVYGHRAKDGWTKLSGNLVLAAGGIVDYPSGNAQGGLVVRAAYVSFSPTIELQEFQFGIYTEYREFFSQSRGEFIIGIEINAVLPTVITLAAVVGQH